jgi:hypothetical protein
MLVHFAALYMHTFRQLLQVSHQPGRLLLPLLLLLHAASCRLSSQERLLQQQQFERLKAVVGSEQRVQQQYKDSISSYLQDQGSRSRGLQAKAAKVGTAVAHPLQIIA